MFCQNCGKDLRPRQRSPKGPQNIACPACGAATWFDIDSPPLPDWARVLTTPAVFGGLLLTIVGLVGFFVFLSWRAGQLPDPRHSIGTFYAAIEEKNEEQALSFILPDERDQGLGFCLNLLLQPNVSLEISELTLRVLESDNQRAEIRVTGQARRAVDGRQFEVGFNDTLELRALNREWYLPQQSLRRLSLCGGV